MAIPDDFIVVVENLNKPNGGDIREVERLRDVVDIDTEETLELSKFFILNICLAGDIGNRVWVNWPTDSLGVSSKLID